MGVRTTLSTNPAMTLGGLKEGVTPLEMAYAYSTIANKGLRVSGSLASYPGGPVAIDEVDGGGRHDQNEKRTERVFPEAVGESAQQLLAGVVLGGTGRGAQIGEFAAGKTGTTENYGDAWFVGFNEELTVAVWVGYPDKLKYMETEYGGQPVAGGTIPTDIWQRPHDLLDRHSRPAGRGAQEEGRRRVPGAGRPGHSGARRPEHDARVAGGADNGSIAPAAAASATGAAGRARSEAVTQPRAGAHAGARSAAAGRRRAERRRRRAGLGASSSPSARPAHGGRPRARDATARAVAETPGQLHRAIDADAFSDRHPRGGRGLARGEYLDRPIQWSPVEIEPDPKRLSQLPRSRAEVLGPLEAAPLTHELDALEWLERPDQDRSADPFRLADRVEQCVHTVRAVHVRKPRLAEQHPGACRQTRVGVARGLTLVVGLGLDDAARGHPVTHHTAD